MGYKPQRPVDSGMEDARRLDAEKATRKPSTLSLASFEVDVLKGTLWKWQEQGYPGARTLEFQYSGKLRNRPKWTIPSSQTVYGHKTDKLVPEGANILDASEVRNHLVFTVTTGVGAIVVPRAFRGFPHHKRAEGGGTFRGETSQYYPAEWKREYSVGVFTTDFELYRPTYLTRPVGNVAPYYPHIEPGRDCISLSMNDFNSQVSVVGPASAQGYTRSQIQNVVGSQIRSGA